MGLGTAQLGRGGTRAEDLLSLPQAPHPARPEKSQKVSIHRVQAVQLLCRGFPGGETQVYPQPPPYRLFLVSTDNARLEAKEWEVHGV